MSTPSSFSRLSVAASFPEDAAAAAALYAKCGLVTHIPLEEKGPRYKGWPNGLSDAEIKVRFQCSSNVGLVLGGASGGLHDVDLDCNEACIVAGYVLPATLRFGRPGKPGSHYLFYASDGATNRDAYADPRGKQSLVELRGDGHQTVFPPSTHKSKEPIRFETLGEPLTLPLAELKSLTATVGALSLLARAWPKVSGSRHELGLALAAAFVRDGIEPGTAETYVAVVAEAAGDEEASSRGRSAHRAADRLEDDLPTTGWTRVAELLGSEGTVVVDTVRDWMGFSPVGHLNDFTSAADVLAAAPRLAALSAVDYAKARKGLKAAHPELNLNDLERAVAAARSQSAALALPEDPDGRPVVVLASDRSHKAVLDETTEKMACWNEATVGLCEEMRGLDRAAQQQSAQQQAVRGAFQGGLFVKDGQLVEVQPPASLGSIATVLVSLDRLRYLTDTATAFYQKGARGGFSTTRAPEHLVKDLAFSLAGRLPALHRLSGCPLVLPGGRVLAEPGYDEETGTLLAFAAGLLGEGPLPEAPTPEQVRDAAGLLVEELLGDFPFDSEASRANALALLLTPVLALLVPPPYPLGLADATKRGTGKGLLSDVISVVATGREAPKTPLPGSNEEIRKTVTAMLLGSPTVVVFDNVDLPVRSAALEILLTTPVYSDRLLGRSEQVHLANGALWLMTGNNLLPQGDLVRRCVRTRLDAGTARPHERAAFRHADLLGWAKANRGRLLRAVLVLVKAWCAAGQPRFEARTMGSYRQWTAVVGGILSVAGVTGFLGNADELYEVADEDGEWEGFLEALHGVYGLNAFLARDVAPMLLRDPFFSDLSEPGRASQLPGRREARQALREATPPYLLASAGSDEHRLAKALGDGFNRRRGERFGPDGLRVVADEGRTKGAKRWRVLRDGARSAETATAEPLDPVSPSKAGASDKGTKRAAFALTPVAPSDLSLCSPAQ